MRMRYDSSSGNNHYQITSYSLQIFSTTLCNCVHIPQIHFTDNKTLFLTMKLPYVFWYFILFSGLIPDVLTTSSLELGHQPVTLAIITCGSGSDDMIELSSSQISRSSLANALHSTSRQKIPVLTMLKSILITWVHSKYQQYHPNRLDILVFSNSRPLFAEIVAEVQKWDPKYASFVTFKFRDVKYPPGKHSQLNIRLKSANI